MSFGTVPILEIAAVVIGLAGPVAALIRELLGSEWSSFLWRTTTVLAAVLREALMIGMVAAVLYGQVWILGAVLDRTTLPAPFTEIMRRFTDIASVLLVVVFAVRAIALVYKHSRHPTDTPRTTNGSEA